MLHDLRFALRRLRMAPGTVIFAVVTLALGIGVTTATYSAVESAAWRPMGIADQDRVVLVSRTNMMRPGPALVSPADFYAIRAAAPSLGASSTAAWFRFPATFVGHGRGAFGSGEMVTGTYFQMLGIAPMIGRLLEPADDSEGAPPVAVLSEAAWRTQFGSEPGVVGQTLKISTLPFTIVGVAPQGFRGVQFQSLTYGTAWVPMSAAPGVLRVTGFRRLTLPDLTVGARIASGESVDTFRTHLAALESSLNASAPLPPFIVRGELPQKQLRYWTTASVTDDAQIDTESEVGRIIILLPGLVLLIVCTNLANLVLSRGASRRQDFGVRRALGATRWQLIREQLVEQGLIAIVGGIGALVVADRLVTGAARLMQTTLAPLTSGIPVDWHLSGSVLPATFVAIVLSVLVSGFIPALHLTRDSLRTVLAQGDSVSTPRWRGRGNLIALQLGVSVGLFLIAIVFVRILIGQQYFDSTRKATPAVDAAFSQLAVAAVPFSTQGLDERAVRGYVNRALTGATHSPDVESVAVTTDGSLLSRASLPLRTLGFSQVSASVTSPGDMKGARDRFVSFAAVTPDYFKAAGAPIVYGRPLDELDTAAVVINEGLALDLFRTANAVGRALPLRLTDRLAANQGPVTPVTVVGVVRGADLMRKSTLHEAAVYAPFSQHFGPNLTFIVRGRSAGAPPIEALRTALQGADPEIAVAFVAGGDIVANGLLAFAGYVATTLVCLAVFALALATVGLYGVLSHVIAKRTREMGIRLALGATPRAIITLVLRDGFRPIVEGLFIGLATATVVRVFMMRTMSGDVAPFNVVECVVCAALLSAAGALACWLPAKRAARVSPNVALRTL